MDVFLFTASIFGLVARRHPCGTPPAGGAAEPRPKAGEAVTSAWLFLRGMAIGHKRRFCASKKIARPLCQRRRWQRRCRTAGARLRRPSAVGRVLMGGPTHAAAVPTRRYAVMTGLHRRHKKEEAPQMWQGCFWILCDGHSFATDAIGAGQPQPCSVGTMTGPAASALVRKAARPFAWLLCEGKGVAAWGGLAGLFAHRPG